ncbi:MAG: hypothetical protein AVDCRST_MAG88-1125, partial [uncultured Thermomicrobiales bacterium]
TMSGAKFSTSRNKVIYVGDFLRDFGFPLFMLVLVVVLSILTVVGVLPLAR